ncbi:radical SAM protein [Dankookia sp. P2]|uniref:radical SAM protein n=1 Tax=Dankookia sp. P2 TaxID=3423955 RepID=UPI003D66F08E
MDLLRLVPQGGPAICNVSVTNLCNATCDFCNFAHDKGFVTDRRSLDASRFADLLARLKEQAGVRFVTFMGGEPLLHKNIVEMVQTATDMGVQPTMVTNGWLLPPKVDALADAGITTLFISIDAADPLVHEKNRGLKGVCERIREATAKLQARGVTVIASVAMTRLIPDYLALARFVKELGFSAITFSYPRKAALGSNSLVWSEDSELVDMSTEELLAAFDGAEIGPQHHPRAQPARRTCRHAAAADRAGRALHLPCRLQVLLHGLELRSLALRGLGQANRLGLGIHAGEDAAGWLPGLHHRLLPRCQHHAAFPGRHRRRFRADAPGPAGRRLPGAGRPPHPRLDRCHRRAWQPAVPAGGDQLTAASLGHR